MDDLESMDFDVRAEEIKKAWDQLAKDKLSALTPEDYLIIQARENLLIAAEKELVEKRLTNAQKETIKHNNYQIFDGELISTNSVPIIFKD